MNNEPLEQGTDELKAAYCKDTPGQSIDEAQGQYMRMSPQKLGQLARDSNKHAMSRLQARRELERRSKLKPKTDVDHEREMDTIRLRNKGIHEEDNDPCWKGYRQLGTKEKDGKTVPNCIPEEKTSSEKAADIADLRKLIANPDTKHAVKNYGSVSAYRDMLRKKLERLQQKESVEAKVDLNLSEQRKIAIVSIITGCKDTSLIESFLSLYDISGRENNILGIRSDFNKFNNK
jgi:hypothetical protein